MKILILNGSPRPNGITKKMINTFIENTKNEVIVIDVFKKSINDCLACEYCHSKGNGSCVQKDDMQEVYNEMKDAEMLIIASPIYYHGLTGKIKCVIDRFYSIIYPNNNTKISKVAMLLASGDNNQYVGAKFSYDGDFIGYLGLEDKGFITNHDTNYLDKIKKLAESL